nr:GPI mannosyltransferase 1-like [Quercus suber]
MGLYNTFFSSPAYVFTVAILFRVVLLFYGRWQDANSPFKYTDIDYLVFTDAARFVAHGRSPYDRATYRYTPLLAWLLLPTTFGGLWFEFGKALFAAGDVVTGWLILLVLRSRGMDTTRAMKFASIWLLNPMVANISTRGSSEGLLAVIVVALLWAVTQRRWVLAGALLGLGVHFKIYPFIYASSIFWALGPDVIGSWVGQGQSKHTPRYLQAFNKARQLVTASSFISFCALSLWMLLLYHVPFVEHTFLYHFTRIDHRHNFSIYNTLLHLNSAQGVDGLKIESLAFIPQLLLSVVVIPLCLAKKDLASTMLAQTFAFVTFNKVCTSQYFLWYMVFLPFYLPNSSMLGKPWLGVTALLLWIAGQAAWLQQGYELEFLGKSTFVPGLWLATVFFFIVNCWILGVIVDDVGSERTRDVVKPSEKSRKDQ